MIRLFWIALMPLSFIQPLYMEYDPTSQILAGMMAKSVIFVILANIRLNNERRLHNVHAMNALERADER